MRCSYIFTFAFLLLLAPGCAGQTHSKQRPPAVSAKSRDTARADVNEARDVITRVYDIRELIHAVPDGGIVSETWESPPMDGATASFGGRARAVVVCRFSDIFPSSQAATQPAEEMRTRQELVDAVVKQIMDRVDPTSWRERGGSVGIMRDLSGQLIVTQTPANHDAIAAVIEAERHRGR